MKVVVVASGKAKEKEEEKYLVFWINLPKTLKKNENEEKNENERKRCDEMR